MARFPPDYSRIMSSSSPRPDGHEQLSPYQASIVRFANAGTGHGVIRATAGAGKTTTLVAVANALPASKRVAFLAFARDAANELRERLPGHVEAMTVHKLGRSFLAARLARAGLRAVLDEGKYARLLERELQLRAGKLQLHSDGLVVARHYLLALTQLARLDLATGPEDYPGLAMRHSLLPPEAAPAELLHDVLARTLKNGMREFLELGTFDFTDMLHLPLQLGLVAPLYDFVCIDEAQDYSRLALEFTVGLVDERAGGRLLFVGDPRQAIFGFAGASTAAFAAIEHRTAATVLPLSVTYRCPTRHVRLASILAPEIEARPGAPQGTVRWIDERQLHLWVTPGSMLLCRSNAPLVRTALQLAQKGVPIRLLGHELKGELVGIARAVCDRHGRISRAALSRYARAAMRQHRRLKGGASAMSIDLSEHLALVECLKLLLKNERALRLQRLEERLDNLFNPAGEHALLSTVHRAKGKEANRVLLLYPELMPAPYARTELTIQGEACVQFVAVTRSRDELIFVSSGGGPDHLWPTEGAQQDDEPDQGPGRWYALLDEARRLAVESRLDRTRTRRHNLLPSAESGQAPGIPKGTL